jgi:hypothetical protein
MKITLVFVIAIVFFSCFYFYFLFLFLFLFSCCFVFHSLVLFFIFCLDGIQGTHICAPNFGYALAARKAKPGHVKAMDLRSLRQCICAAEPIRAESLHAFTQAFAPAGFDPKTFNCGNYLCRYIYIHIYIDRIIVFGL